MYTWYVLKVGCKRNWCTRHEHHGDFQICVVITADNIKALFRIQGRRSTSDSAAATARHHSLNHLTSWGSIQFRRLYSDSVALWGISDRHVLRSWLIVLLNSFVFIERKKNDFIAKNCEKKKWIQRFPDLRNRFFHVTWNYHITWNLFHVYMH